MVNYIFTKSLFQYHLIPIVIVKKIERKNHANTLKSVISGSDRLYILSIFFRYHVASSGFIQVTFITQNYCPSKYAKNFPAEKRTPV